MLRYQWFFTTDGSSLNRWCIKHTCVCEPHPNRGSAIRHTEHNYAMEICNGTQTVMLGKSNTL